MTTTGHNHPIVQLVVAINGVFKTKVPATGEWVLTKILKDDPLLAYPSEQPGQINFELIHSCLQSENWDKLYTNIIKVFRFEDAHQHKPKDEELISH